MPNFTQSEFSYAELYKLEFGSWHTLYLTTWDANISYGGNTYVPGRLVRGEISQSASCKIDTVNITLSTDSNTTVSRNGYGYFLMQVARYGWFANAKLTIYAVDPDAALIDAETLFVGFCKSDIEYNQSTINLTFTSILDLLSTQLPRLQFKQLCNHRFGDSLCGIDIDNDTDADGEAIKHTGTIYARTIKTITATTFYDAAERQKFRYGMLEFTSGRLNGMQFLIHKQENIDGSRGRITMAYSFPLMPGEYDTFKAYYGCERTGTCCDERYNNYDNFFGFEYIPQSTIARRSY